MNDLNKRITRAKAIRLKCLDCCAQQYKEVQMCTLKKCPLWRYRMGKEENDNLKPEGKRKTQMPHEEDK